MSGGAFAAPDGCRLAFEVVGEGRPVLWQHGLGADRTQPAEVFPTQPGLMRLTLECRGHGASALGDPDRLSIAAFAEDALALLDHLGVERAVVGGISLGAAVAARLAALRPERAGGLVLARPAWVDAAAPPRLRVYAQVADLLAAHGSEAGRRLFEASPAFAAVKAESPDNATSLRSFFTRPDADSTVALLRRLPLDGPGLGRSDLAGIAAPTLVVGNDHDYVHPLDHARMLRDLIPGARLVEITSKTVDKRAYVEEFRAALAAFLAEPERRW